MASPDGSDALAARWFADHGASLRAYLRRGTGDLDDAEDLLQEVFVRALRALRTYDARGRERAWLFTIAHNLLVGDHRSRRRRPTEVADHEPVGPPRQDVRLAIDEALARLPDEERHAFLLAELGGLRYDEIAALRNSTHAAVRSRIFRARLALRDALAPPAPLGPTLIRRTTHDH